MAGREKARNQRKRSVSPVTSGLALFLLHCVRWVQCHLPGDARAADTSIAPIPEAEAWAG